MLKRSSRRKLLTTTGSALTAALLAACGAKPSAQTPPIKPSLVPPEAATTQPAAANTTVSANNQPTARPKKPQKLDRMPYLQAVSATDVTISWKLANNEASWVRVGPVGGTLRRIDVEAGKRADIHVDQLQPNTAYTYEVGAGNTVLTPRYTFRSAPDKHADFTFLAFGDSGEGNAVQNNLGKRMLALKPDMIIHVGDFVYGEDGDLDNRYFSVYSEMLAQTTVFPAIGDNEIEFDGGKAFRKAFVFPPNAPSDSGTHAYSFDYGSAHFVALDTETATGKLSPQYAWLEADLAASQQPWKFVYFHRPVHSAGDGRQNKDLRKAWGPLFEQYGVTAVFSGHDHNYQRSEPLREYTEGPGGVVYIITGGGGADLRPVTDDEATVIAEAAYHVVQVHIKGNVASVRAIRDDGSVLDEATLQRNTNV